jgi:hypothetical protein
MHDVRVPVERLGRDSAKVEIESSIIMDEIKIITKI